MEHRENDRRYDEHFCTGQHLKLEDLREKAGNTGKKKYLFKDNIRDFPHPEFRVSHLIHDTEREGLRGIRSSGGFRQPKEGKPVPLVWWSLALGDGEMEAAETRLLEETYPERTDEQVRMQQSFLGTFATSPAFLTSSRFGSYRFKFPLEEVLKAYSQQFCCGEEPMMRIFETVLYKQEVMYSVLVHSPARQELFSRYPLLTDDANSVCTFKDGRFIWRPEAMCETHRYELVRRHEDQQMEAQELFGCDVQFYVWDHVSVALHVDYGQVLEFDADKLRENLKFCEKGTPQIVSQWCFDSFSQAEALVKELWPKDPSELQMSNKDLMNSSGSSYDAFRSPASLVVDTSSCLHASKD